MDEELISIYGTGEYKKLSEFEKKKLSYLECCQIIYIYASSEGIFYLFLARILLKYKIGSPEYNFILREQIEEYRHQDMFSRTLEILKSKHTEIGGFWKWTMKWEALNVLPKYFYILQVVIEIISGDFGGKCTKNKEVFKLVRDVSEIHDLEEGRHIAFAQIMLDKYFKNSGFFGKTLGGWFVFFDILFINHHYIKLENFKKLGVKNYKELYKISKNNWKDSKLKNFDSKRGRDFCNRYGFITGGNKWAFKWFLGFYK
ncbi:MAG: diiron oxygenase [Candidatus Gracilibacteria bacterium]|nr:diiron oxygenase [Candidatus Gracilibacteria bacterium]